MFRKMINLILLNFVLFQSPLLRSEEEWPVKIELDRNLEDITLARTNNSQSYISYDVNVNGVADLLNPIQERYQLLLQSRGEAHITLLTPDELGVLKKVLPLSFIQDFFEKSRPEVKLNIYCLGKGEALLKNKLEKTFFLVIHSKELVKLRQQLFQIAIKRGVQTELVKEKFIPDLYFPHITIGFTKEDLHYQQGVVKNDQSCDLNFAFVN